MYLFGRVSSVWRSFAAFSKLSLSPSRIEVARFRLRIQNDHNENGNDVDRAVCSAVSPALAVLFRSFLRGVSTRSRDSRDKQKLPNA